MKMEKIPKYCEWEEARILRQKWNSSRDEVVFTNGCFDILHKGHVTLLEKAKSLGAKLIVALNSDSSVRRLKGAQRPVRPELERVEIIGGLRCVDMTVIFEQDTPFELIEFLEPDVLVKGGDWKIESIVGADLLQARGKRVEVIPFEEGRSTTGIIGKIRSI